MPSLIHAIAFLITDKQKIWVKFETKLKEIETEANEVHAALVVRKFDPKFTGYIYQNAKDYHNFMNVPSRRMILSSKKVITRINFTKGSEIKKRKELQIINKKNQRQRGQLIYSKVFFAGGMLNKKKKRQLRWSNQ